MAKAMVFDEMRGVEGGLRPLYRNVADWLERTPADLLAKKRF